MHKIILASQSPRRKQLMEAAELSFDIIIADVDETNPEGMHGSLVPEYLAKKKAAAIEERVHDAIIIAADTVVLLDDEILGKPTDEADAINILSKLSGRKHEVVTGVCMQQGDKQICFSTTTEVYFRTLTLDQIKHYVAAYKPYDKAGAYAIQEWIGMIGIEKINGDYYNVMGLPIGEVVQILNRDFQN
ncbi:septum formation protein Maf [Chitinophagaceae bacterium IBVUCB1]|nr:septum formation protein Maf [Chitinophagaceae bacterium IBVUCB1]